MSSSPTGQLVFALGFIAIFIGLPIMCIFWFFKTTTSGAQMSSVAQMFQCAEDQMHLFLLGRQIRFTHGSGTLFHKDTPHYDFLFPMAFAKSGAHLHLKLTPPVTRLKPTETAPRPSDKALLDYLEVDVDMGGVGGQDRNKVLALPCVRNALKRWCEIGCPVTFDWDDKGLRVRGEGTFPSAFQTSIFIGGFLILIRELGPMLRENGAFGPGCKEEFAAERITPKALPMADLGYSDCLVSQPADKVMEKLGLSESDEGLYDDMDADVPMGLRELADPSQALDSQSWSQAEQASRQALRQ